MEPGKLPRLPIRLSQALIVGLLSSIVVPSAYAADEAKRLAYSKSLGIEVFAEGDEAEWCQDTLSLRLEADDPEIYSVSGSPNPKLGELIGALGKLMPNTCADAQALAIRGMDREGNLLFTGEALAEASWKLTVKFVDVSDSVKPEEPTDLDSVMSETLPEAVDEAVDESQPVEDEVAVSDTSEPEQSLQPAFPRIEVAESDKIESDVTEASELEATDEKEADKSDAPQSGSASKPTLANVCRKDRLAFVHDAVFWGNQNDPGYAAASAGDFRSAVIEWEAQLQQRYGYHDQIRVNLGRLYETGNENLPKDLEKAAKYYEEASANGLGRAKIYLARLYESGCGIDQSYTEAARLYLTTIAGMHRYQTGVVAADKFVSFGIVPRQVRLNDRGQPLGYNEAIFRLGRLYRDGDGVERDGMQAARLFKKAVLLGQNSAEAELKKALRQIRGRYLPGGLIVTSIGKLGGQHEAFLRLPQLYHCGTSADERYYSRVHLEIHIATNDPANLTDAAKAKSTIREAAELLRKRCPEIVEASMAANNQIQIRVLAANEAGDFYFTHQDAQQVNLERPATQIPHLIISANVGGRTLQVLNFQDHGLKAYLARKREIEVQRRLAALLEAEQKLAQVNFSLPLTQLVNQVGQDIGVFERMHSGRKIRFVGVIHSMQELTSRDKSDKKKGWGVSLAYGSAEQSTGPLGRDDVPAVCGNVGGSKPVFEPGDTVVVQGTFHAVTKEGFLGFLNCDLTEAVQELADES